MTMKQALRVTLVIRRSLLTLAMLMLTTAAQAEDHTWQEYLKRVDRNGDGQIDRLEIMLVPPRYAIGVKAMLAPRFKEIDRDGNGKLRFDEIDADLSCAGPIGRKLWGSPYSSSRSCAAGCWGALMPG